MSWRHILITLACATLVLVPTTVAAQEPCPNNLIANPSFEDGSHSAGDHGAPPAYVIGNGWNPWSTWGESPHSREAEFDVEDIALLGRYSTYRVNSGKHSQKFSTIYATHNAGVYQRIAVPKGSKVTFSIWVQMYTGEEILWWDEEYYSDLNSPGNYRVYVGLDPYGDEPPSFGTPPSDRTIWSAPVLDRETRREGDHNRLYDAWVNIRSYHRVHQRPARVRRATQCVLLGRRVFGRRRPDTRANHQAERHTNARADRHPDPGTQLHTNRGASSYRQTSPHGHPLAHRDRTSYRDGSGPGDKGARAHSYDRTSSYSNESCCCHRQA